MKISQKRKVGAILGRSGISERIITIAEDIATGSYKNAIEKGAQIAQLVDAASFDCYWAEKAQNGKYREEGIFDTLLEIKDRDQFRLSMTKMSYPYCDGSIPRASFL